MMPLRHAPAPRGIPTPGSDAARAQGCTCPQIDNQFGRGHGPDARSAIFAIRADCVVHQADGVEAAPSVAAAAAPPPRPKLRTIGALIICPVCERVVPRTGRRGRPALIHDECRPDAERRAVARQRAQRATGGQDA